MKLCSRPINRVIGIAWLSLAAYVAHADDPPRASAGTGPSGPIEGCPNGSESASFWKRLSDSYKRHLFPDAQPPAPAPDPNAPFDEQAAGHRVDLAPPPVSSPPWPYSVWNEGGTELIGYENMYSSALMDAIYCGEHGKAWKDSRFTRHWCIAHRMNGRWSIT